MYEQEAIVLLDYLTECARAYQEGILESLPWSSGSHVYSWRWLLNENSNNSFICESRVSSELSFRISKNLRQWDIDDGISRDTMHYLQCIDIRLGNTGGFYCRRWQLPAVIKKLRNFKIPPERVFIACSELKSFDVKRYSKTGMEIREKWGETVCLPFITKFPVELRATKDY